MARINVNRTDEGEGKVSFSVAVADEGDLAVRVGGRSDVLISPNETLHVNLDGAPFLVLTNVQRMTAQDVEGSIAGSIDAADPHR